MFCLKHIWDVQNFRFQFWSMRPKCKHFFHTAILLCIWSLHPACTHSVVESKCSHSIQGGSQSAWPLLILPLIRVLEQQCGHTCLASLVFFLICWQSLGFVLSMLVAEQLMDFLKRSAFLSTSTKRFALLNAFWNSDPSKVGLGFFLHLISSKLGTLEASCASNKNFLCTPSCCSTSTALE